MNRGCFLLLIGIGAAGTARAVTPVPADGVIAPAHYLDLEGKRLRFTPSRGGYRLAASKASPPGDFGRKLGRPDFPHEEHKYRSWGWRASLPFAFAYGGRTWRELFINSAGNLTFERPEAQLYRERETWPDGTMQSLAGSIANRAAAGQERMICALWGINTPEESKSNVFVRQSAREFVVTWRVERYRWFGEGYRPLGPNLFQARLTPNGAIEFNYHKLSEKDGIAGLFTGGGTAKRLDLMEARAEDAEDPRLRISSVEASLVGATVRFTFLMSAPVMTSVPDFKLWYYVVLARDAGTCEIGVEVGRNAKSYQLGECKGVPAFRVEGNRLELYASVRDAAASLDGGGRWKAEVLWQRKPGSSIRHTAGEHGLKVPVDAFHSPRLSAAKGYREGNIVEVFHYPRVEKSLFPQLRYIYERYQPQDDFAVVLTDFRIDDLHNHQGTPGAFNVSVQGIGDRLAKVPQGAAIMGSSKLQLATGPVYLGPRFDEVVVDGDRLYRNYAGAVGWMAHELGHRWGIALRFRNPDSGGLVDLSDNAGHWGGWLNTPSMISVWRMFSDQRYSEKSQMEGVVYDELPDGSFRRQRPSWNIASGFSALDLYLMGLIGPGDVPDTFLIRDPQGSSERLRGVKVPVRIQDIIAAHGERVPGVRESQREFSLGIYLLHEANRPPHPEKLRQAGAIEKQLIDYFRTATGGRMRLAAAPARKRSEAR